MTRRMLAIVAVTAWPRCVTVNAADDPAETAKKELEALQGKWTITSSEYKGNMSGLASDRVVTIKGDQVKITFFDSGESVTWTLKLDFANNPTRIDLKGDGGAGLGHMLGLYARKGDTLTVCLDPFGEGRPTEFKSPTDKSHWLGVLERGEPRKDPPRPPVEPATPVEPAKPVPDPAVVAEREAAELVRLGRAFARSKNVEAARKQLTRVVEQYAQTKAAAEAADLLKTLK